MEKYNKESLRNIQRLVQVGTGTDIGAYGESYSRRRRMGRTALITVCLICVAVLSAFAYAEFTMLDSEKLGLAPAYQGDGKFEIVITNFSDKRLKLQDKVKVMQWSTGEEVKGDNTKIKMSGLTVNPNSQGVVSIDISEGYDIAAMEKALPDGDWYYFVLTNNNFAFGQDWMCDFDFERHETGAVMQESYAAMKELIDRKEAKNQETDVHNKNMEISGGQESETGAEGSGSNAAIALIYEDWSWPTVSRSISAYYGDSGNGAFSDHINISGESGDEIYAAAGGTVAETGFDASAGNFIIINVDGSGIDGEVSVKYGHLKDISVSAGDTVKKGQVIGTLGQSGMATGPNLSFTVMHSGSAIDPLSER